MTTARSWLAVPLLLVASQASSLTTLPCSCVAESNASWSAGYTAGWDSGTAQGFNAAWSAGYTAGWDSGTTQGFNSGFSAGQGQGANDGAAWCAANPAACGITLSSCLPPPQYGETEPNDNIVAADPLVLDVPFWGQSYGADDTDWFYLETKNQNQTLTINFQVPRAEPTGWLLWVRDAAGNVFATIDTSNAPTTVEPDLTLTYKVTLGLAGTYYIEVKSNIVPVTSNPYTISAVLQDSPLDTGNFQIGFYDAEVENNDLPSLSNPLATGVTMYGLVNLTFDVPVPQDDGFVWGQSDDDWFRYTTAGDEIVTLTFCGKDTCDPGDWLVEVYDAATAAQLEAGVSEQALDPILAYNTSTGDTEPRTVRFGLMQAGTYYMRVNHKRLFTAPCTSFRTDKDNNGLVGPDPVACGCDTGYKCDIKVLNPGEPIPNPEDPTEQDYPLCLDGSGGGTDPQCTIGCLCTAFGGVVEIPEGATTGQYNFTWYGTKLPPFTLDTPAYDDFENRASPY